MGTSGSDERTVPPSLTVGLFKHRGQVVDLAVDGRHGRQHFGVVEQRVLVETRLELVDEVDQTPRAMNQRHPDFRLDLCGRGLGRRVVDARALDAVPDQLVAAGPFHQPIDPLGDIPEELGSVRPIEAGDRIDVERDDVGPRT